MRTKAFKNLIYGTMDEFTNIGNWRVCPDIRRSLAKEYLDSWSTIHLHIGFDSEEYCAILDGNIEVLGVGSGHMSDIAYEDIIPQGTSAQNEVPVFIYVTEDLEIPEILPVVLVPRTIARLKRIDNGDYCVGHPLELNLLRSFVFVDVLEDRELALIGGHVSRRQDKLPNKMVERTSEVVEHFPDEKFNPVGHRRYFSEAIAIDILSRCIINIFGDTIRIDIAEGRQLFLQRLQVLLGPVKFSERTINGRHVKQFRKESEGAKDSKGFRNSNPQAQGRVRRNRKGGETHQTSSSPPPPEEVASRTAPSHHRGDYTAKHIHSGSLEDV